MSAYRHLITGLLRAGLLNKPYSALPAAAISTRQASKSALDVSGIFPPIPTPFNADESIAYDKLEANIKKWNEIPLRGKADIKIKIRNVLKYIYEKCLLKEMITTLGNSVAQR